MIASGKISSYYRITTSKISFPISNFSLRVKSASGTSSVSLMATSNEASGFRIQETFSNLKENGKVAFIPYITAGDPDLKTTEEALMILDACGSDIIEVGVPYCDQLADGPVIQAAATRSLAKGTTLNSVLSMLEKMTPRISSPVVLFTYYNPILKRGVNLFMSQIKSAGVSGLLVPDIPLEETEALRAEASRNGIELVLLITPTTPTSRMKRIAEASQGFVYLVSSVGVTGTRKSLNDNVRKILIAVKENTSKPVAVGFGISNAVQVRQVAEWGADGVIVGSAVVKILGESATTHDALRDMQVFVKSLASALP